MSVRTSVRPLSFFWLPLSHHKISGHRGFHLSRPSNHRLGHAYLHLKARTFGYFPACQLLIRRIFKSSQRGALLPYRTRSEIEDVALRACPQAAVRARPSFSEHPMSAAASSRTLRSQSFDFGPSRRLPSAGNGACSSRSRFSRARARDSFDFDTSRENRVASAYSERGFDRTRGVLQSPLQRLGKLETTTHDKLRARHNASETSSFDGGRSVLAHLTELKHPGPRASLGIS